MDEDDTSDERTSLTALADAAERLTAVTQQTEHVRVNISLPVDLAAKLKHVRKLSGKSYTEILDPWISDLHERLSNKD